ncbi:MAG: hypothetical protein ISS28_04225 [Candidatus Cloacimonetes bacterium]|nr:hypothetical protein [Candidatus Cloacimonadota bacterium]MBL7086291.1 hypothetical protein [Candidatus Cloacimonadota bacterium]
MIEIKKNLSILSLASIILILINFFALIVCISCSHLTISDTSPIPTSLQHINTIKLSFIPQKICYCEYSNTFLILDDKYDCIFRVDNKGRIQQKIGEFGFDKSQFVTIADISTDSFGNLFVLDNVSNKVVQYDEFGQFVNCSSYSEVYEPELIAVKDNGDIILYDSSSNEIYCFDNTKNLCYNFGKFDFINPSEIAVSNDINFVLDKGSNSIIAFDNFGGVVTQYKSNNKIIDISTTKCFMYYIDDKANIFCCKKYQNFKHSLASLTDNFPLIIPQLIISYNKTIGIIDNNKIYLFQLLNN